MSGNQAGAAVGSLYGGLGTQHFEQQRDQQLRLECLRLAQGAIHGQDPQIACAKAFYEFLTSQGLSS